MPVISRVHHYLFLQCPRTASTALGEGVLIPHLQGEQLPPKHLRDDEGRVVVDAKHATLAQLRSAGLLSAEDASRLLKFTTIRNPFDREVSVYEKMRGDWRRSLERPDFVRLRPARARTIELANELSFPRWLEHRYGTGTPRLRQWRRPLLRATSSPPGRELITTADHVLRYEHLQDDFDDLVARLGITSRHEIPRINVTENRRPDHRSYYDRVSRRVIEHVYRYEIERFGYEF